MVVEISLDRASNLSNADETDCWTVTLVAVAVARSEEREEEI